MHPYSRINTTTAWKKLRFILSDKFDFYMIDNLSISIHAFASRILMSFSVYETLLLRYVNLSISFRELPFRVEMSPFWLKHMYSVFSCIHRVANSTCYLLQTLQRGFGLVRCICSKCYVICVVCVRKSFCEYHLLIAFLEWNHFFIRSFDVQSTLSKQILNWYEGNVSPCRTPATMSKSLCLYPMCEHLFSCFYRASL